MEDFPQVAGKSWGLTKELMEGDVWGCLGIRGNEKFCTNLNLPGHPGLGIIDNGEDWKGPMDLRMRVSKCSPMYLPLDTSKLTMLCSCSWYISTDGALGGDCIW